MASSFKIKLKLPPNPNQPGTSSSANNSPQRSSVPAEGGSSIADGASSAMSEDMGDEGEEFDELEDSPPPNEDGTPGASASASGSPGAKARAKASSGKAGSKGSLNSMKKSSSSRPLVSLGLSKPVDQMTIEEIEALPAAKRRKSLKARGAAGPGRGWRKGLKMDQKPVYVQPGESPPSKVAPGTPVSFASRPKSSLARDALSKTSTPLRSESPFSRGSPMNLDDVLLDAVESSGPKGRGEDRKAHNTWLSGTSLGPAAAAIHHRSTQPVLPLAKIPIGFVTVTSLDRSGARRPVRAWQREQRQVVSLGGKLWSTSSWITKQQSQGQLQRESAKDAAADTSPPSTPMESVTTTKQPASRPADVGPSPLSNSHTPTHPPPRLSQPSPEVDWRGSSAAFSAAIKRKAGGGHLV